MSILTRHRKLWLILVTVFVTLAIGAWWLFRDRPWLLFGYNGISFWTVTSYDGKPAEAGLLLMFDGYQLALDGKCGQQRWFYDRDDDAIEISKPSGATLRCAVAPTPPEIDRFMAIRETVRTLKIDGDRLALLNQGGEPVLEAGRLPAKGLDNRTWNIAAFQFEDKLVETRTMFDAPEKVHLTFIQGGFHGYAGCEYLFGRYVLDPKWILIDPLRSDIAFCQSGEHHINDAIIAALSAGRFMTQADDRLTLTGEDGRIQMVLTPLQSLPEP